MLVYSRCHFNNILNMLNLTNEDIGQIEKCVREDTLAYLENKMKINFDCDEVLHEDLLVDYFGDLYASDPTKFRFEIGDIKLINLVRDHIKSQYEKNGAKYLRRFKEKKVRKMKPKNGVDSKSNDALIELSYPEENDDGNDSHSMNCQSLSIQLVERLKVYLLKFKINASIIQQVNLNTVTVEVLERGGIIAGVYCMLCQKEKPKKKLRPMKVYYKNDGKGSKYWVLSNLGQHINKSHGQNAKSSEHVDEDLNMDTDPETAENEVKSQLLEISTIETIDVSVENIIQNIESNEDKKLFDQISAQINKMFTTTMMNNEQLEEIPFDLLDQKSHKLMVVNMPGDGSCLFHSVTHQLYNFEASSAEHKRASVQLRQAVCKHISMHFTSFKLQLKGRVYETVDEDEIKDMNAECLFILNERLPQSSFYGGMETLLAVSQMFNVNILVFDEGGTCNFPAGFNDSYDRTLILAYRLNEFAQQEDENLRNHYDSVCEMASKEISDTFKFLSRALKNRVEISDTTL